MDYSYSNELFGSGIEDLSGESFFYRKKTHIYDFLKKILKIPLSILSKVIRTLFRAIRLLLSIIFAILTLGLIEECRNRLKNKAHLLTEELVDWFFYPFAVISGVGKSLFRVLFRF